MAIYFGYNPPFIGGAEGVMSRQEDLRLVKNDILQLLLTMPGERVHRPTFGTVIRSSLFDPSDETSYEILADDIEEKLRLSEPRIFNTQVFVQPAGDHVVNIRIVANLTFDPNAVLELDQEVQV